MPVSSARFLYRHAPVSDAGVCNHVKERSCPHPGSNHRCPDTMMAVREKSFANKMLCVTSLSRHFLICYCVKIIVFCLFLPFIFLPAMFAGIYLDCKCTMFSSFRKIFLMISVYFNIVLLKARYMENDRRNESCLNGIRCKRKKEMCQNENK